MPADLFKRELRRCFNRFLFVPVWFEPERACVT